MGYLHNLTAISEDCVVQHLKVSYNTIFTDKTNPIFVAQHNLLDCVNRPLKLLNRLVTGSRFSDSELGGVTIAYVRQPDLYRKRRRQGDQIVQFLADWAIFFLLGSF
jgi:hypothetical protein